MKNKKKNVFIILLLIIVVLPILLSFIKCDNGNSKMDPSTTIQEEMTSSKRLKRAKSYIGTAVPNSGYVENVYFNYNLNVDNVVSILDLLTYSGANEIFPSEQYVVLCSQDTTKTISVIKTNSYSGIVFIDFTSLEEQTIFDSRYGWSDGFSSITINSICINEIEAYNLYGFGIQNNKLSNLISSTPFIETENKTGLQIIFEEIGSGLSGLAAFFVGLFNSIVPVFWVNGQPTIITILVLAGVVLTIGFWGIDKLLKLFKIGLGDKK